MPEENITKLTQRYISEHPSIKDCLRKGLLNYSALSREICEEYGLKSFDAVLIACRRYYNRIKTQLPQEKKIVSLIKKAKVTVKNKIAVAIVEKPRDFERIFQLQREIMQDRGDFYLIEGTDVVTIISNLEYVDAIKEAMRGKLIKLSTDLAQITMIFDERIETTPGVLWHIYGLFADNEINIREEMSCWTDIILVIAQDDVSRALTILT